MGRWPRPPSHLTRREALGLLGAGAGFALTPGPGRAAPAQQGATDIAFPEGAVIRAILGDLAPEALGGGATLFHEHLDLFQNYSSPPVERDPAAGPLTDEEAETFVALVAEELRMAAADGMSCMVDAGILRGSERELEFLRQMSLRSGVPVVVAGAYWRAPFPDEVAGMDVDELSEHFSADAQAQRWGAFGEVGTSMEMLEVERTFLQAVSRAHHATSLPIFTHTEHDNPRRFLAFVPQEA